MWKWVMGAMLMISLAYAGGFITKVIPLNYLDSAAADQVLKPLLHSGESISYSGNQLIVNASEDTLTRIQSVLKSVDIPPILFTVVVHQDQSNWLQQASDQTDVVYGTTRQSNAGNDQSVQVLSGASAFVSTGTDVPVMSSVSGGWWNPGVSYQREQVKQGFLIEPELRGGKVRLKIRRVNNQVDSFNNQQIDKQQLDTITIVPLNQWIKLGSSGEATPDRSDASDDVYGAGAAYQDKGTLYIKVTKVNS